jgi:hypothetical protein
VRQAYCWPAIELVLTRSASEALPELVDLTIASTSAHIEREREPTNDV